MAKEILLMFLTLAAGMILFRLLFSEIDVRGAVRSGNLAYFLQFEGPFQYRRLAASAITIAVSFLLFGGFFIIAEGGLVYFVLFVVLGVLADFISSLIYHYVGRYRFKNRIQEIHAYVEGLKVEMEKPYEQWDIDDRVNANPLENIIPQYLHEEDHIAVFSRDGGSNLSQWPHYGQVVFCLDRHYDEAVNRFTDTPIRVMPITEKYPFKDESMDMVVCYDEDLNPNEAGRILKSNGVMLISQWGSQNLEELFMFAQPRVYNRVWNLNQLSQGFTKMGYQILDGAEYMGEIRFRSLSAFYHYNKVFGLPDIALTDRFVNQYHYIDNQIKENGFFTMKRHHFFLVTRKAAMISAGSPSQP